MNRTDTLANKRPGTAHVANERTRKGLQLDPLVGHDRLLEIIQ